MESKNKYRSIKCQECNKTYLSNYIFQHRRSKNHLKNIRIADLKNNLLRIDEEEPEQQHDLNDLINTLQINLDNIKNFLQNKNPII
jgi:hypothetical protein